MQFGNIRELYIQLTYIFIELQTQYVIQVTVVTVHQTMTNISVQTNC